MAVMTNSAPGVRDLVVRFVRGEHRIDGCSRSTDAPGSHDRDQQLDAIGQHDRHHVTEADSESGQLRGNSFRAICELFIREFDVVVPQARLLPVLLCKIPSQISDVRHESQHLSFVCDSKHYRRPAAEETVPGDQLVQVLCSLSTTPHVRYASVRRLMQHLVGASGHHLGDPAQDR